MRISRGSPTTAIRHHPQEEDIKEFEALEKSTIAELSAATIECLTREELIRVIKASCLPVSYFTPETSRRWELLDQPTLKRLAYLARRCCQNQGY